MGNTSRSTIEGWLRRGQAQGARWVIIGCDRFEHEDYPIFIQPDDNPWVPIKHIGDNGTSGMGDTYHEVYDLDMSIEDQLQERLAMHLPPRPQGEDWDRL